MNVCPEKMLSVTIRLVMAVPNSVSSAESPAATSSFPITFALL